VQQDVGTSPRFARRSFARAAMMFLARAGWE
jgi:hypothetical protein